MQYDPPLIRGILLKRYKRFLADVELADGSVTTAHTPNTGSMMGCADPGSVVWLRDSRDPARKCRFSWELTETCGGVLVGVNTGLANRLVREALEAGRIAELTGYARLRPEVRYGSNSRIDLLLDNDGEDFCYVEVKNVTACLAPGVAAFPDAVTARGTKHLLELADMVAAGHRAVMVFCVQRQDARKFRPADEIDPVYGRTLRQVVDAGVEALAYQARVSPHGVELAASLPVEL